MSGFAMVPAWLLAKQPSGNAVLAYCTLAGYGKFDTKNGVYDRIWPSMSTLAKDMGVALNTARRVVHELRDLNALLIFERKDERGQDTNSYQVRFGQLVEETSLPNFGRDPLPNLVDEQESTYPEEVLTPLTTPGRTPGVVPPREECPRKVRASRLPESFTPSRQMILWGEVRAPRVDLDLETEKFRNYWAAKAGSGATKLDWPATWRNWILSAATRSAPSARSPNFGGGIDWQAAMERAVARDARTAT